MNDKPLHPFLASPSPMPLLRASLLTLALIAWPCLSTAAEPERGLQRLSRARLEEFRRLQYGMFVHFGMPTFAGPIPDGNAGKINPYEEVPIDVYNPRRLDVDQWIRVAKDAGMKYAVLTTKHHNGFCLWPSKQTRYHVGNSPVKTDVVGEFVAACRRHGLVPGLYYASWDEYKDHRFGSKVASEVGWGNDYTTHEYRQFQMAQIEELLTNYGPIGEFFIDIPRYLGPDGRVAQYEQIARLQPDCIISFNQGFSSGDTLDTKVSWPTDVCTMERRLPSNPFHPMQRYEERWMLQIPGHGPDKQPWYIPGEVNDTIGREWFFRPTDRPRSDAELLGMYLVCRERGVNFLFNVPPDPDGLIPQMYIDALMRLKTNLAKLEQ
jgi:alpha-L-fucosidase